MDTVTAPYFDNRKAHNDRYMDLARGKRNWQLVCGGMLLANLTLTGGIMQVSSRQQVIPYVVEVDAAGVSTAIRELRPTTVQDPIVVAGELTHFIKQLRTVTTDVYAREKAINETRGKCLEAAHNYLRAYFAANPIEEAMKRGRTFPENFTARPLSPTSWRVRWNERTWDEDAAKVISAQGWEADIEVAFVQPRTEEEMRVSPLGIYIKSLFWRQS